MTIVAKIGGRVAKDASARAALVSDVAGLRKKGKKIILVHGGGAQVNDLLGRLGIPPKFAHGLRVTDAGTLDVVEWVLTREGKALAHELSRAGCP
ncbi:MAG: amino acid kinase family protein, partial [Methanobacteriota archaeon]